MRAFEDSDMDEINGWYVAHGRPAIVRSDLPAFGVIEPGVGCAFLYRTDSAVGLLDGVVTNPRADPEMRHRAFVAGFLVIEAEAKRLGVTRLLAMCQHPDTVRRTVEYGYRPVATYLTAKEIT